MPKPPTIPGREEAAQQRGLNGAAVETPPRKTRRRFSASEKLRIVQAADEALASGERGAVEALLRKEGIYGSHLTSWRRQLHMHGVEGLAGRKPGRKPKLGAKERELLAAQKKIDALEKKLRVAKAVIELQKKPTKCWGSR